MSEQKEKKLANIHTSYVGTFKADSLSVQDGVASATLVSASETELSVKGYNAHAETLQNAYAAGGEVILRGSILNGKDNKHLAVYGVGPEMVTGKVSNVRDNFGTYEAEGKMPYMNLFVQKDLPNGSKIGVPVVAYGDDALSLKGIKEGDILEAPGRQTHEQRNLKNKETGEPEEKWVSIYRVAGPGRFGPNPEAKKEAEAPEPGM